jgi:hypothetical protein
MKYTVTEVGEDFVRVWDGQSKVDKRPNEPHTDQYFVGRDHGFLPGDEVVIGLSLKHRPEPKKEL